MSAFLDDAAAIQNEDAVGALHRRKPMRDDDRRAPAHEPIESLLHEELALVVERARCFVEQEDARVPQDRPRDRDTLALPDREADTALADDRLHALGHPPNELGGVR